MKPHIEADGENGLAAAPAQGLSADHFGQLAELIEAQAGIKLSESKRLMAEVRLGRRARDLNLPSVNDYCAFLFERGGLKRELPHVIDVMTTNKTDFFREDAHFKALVEWMAPALIRRRAERGPIIKFWSVASSTGAEAYTAAMVLNELASKRGDFGYRVVGTDISHTALKSAQAGVYPGAMITPIPEPFRVKYLMRRRESSGGDAFRIVPELRRFVRFYPINLKDERYDLDGDIDVAFLRNVLIYFDRELQRAVVDRVVSHLRPGGFLVLGHSETTAAASAAGLTAHANGVWEKRGD